MDDLSQIRRIRNIGIAAHIDAGKTTTTERLLYYSGRIHRAGDVDDGTTITDFDVEEQQRGITIYSAAVTLEWNNHCINLIDTPGHVDFTAEVERSLRVLDGAVVVFDAKEGVEAQSETVWRQADRYHVPRICFMNKMDKTGADFEAALDSVRERLHGNPIPIHLPTGSESSFDGFIDLIQMKRIRFQREGEIMQRLVEDIPADWLKKARGARHSLEEHVAELDDALMDHYLTHESLADEQIVAGLRKGTIERRCQPVLCGSSLKHVGARDILNRVCDFLPSPLDVPPIRGFAVDDPEKRVERPCDPKGPLAALVFKVVADSHSDLFFVRIYSGVLKAGSRVVNPRNGRKENVPRMFRVFAKRREQVEEASAGDIVAVIGLKESLTGDTLCEQHGACLLERIEFPEPVISMSIEPQSSNDRDKLIQALEMLARSDPTFSCRTDAEAGQLLISGMGELHLEVMCHRLERDFNVGVRVGKPRVAYRETITVAANAEGRFIREAGGRRHFAIVYMRLEPFTPEPGQPVFQFVNEAPAGLL
ncbi:MAG: GTP-binding protein, partial [Phycisphaerales bacterium]|nr:GTP-binding protein [Phycisphaerales bacterium]